MLEVTSPLGSLPEGVKRISEEPQLQSYGMGLLLSTRECPLGVRRILACCEVRPPYHAHTWLPDEPPISKPRSIHRLHSLLHLPLSHPTNQ